MPVRFDVSNAPALIRYTFEGEWSVQQFVEQRRQLILAGQLTGASALLFDLRQTTAAPTIRDLHATLPNGSISPVCRA